MRREGVFPSDFTFPCAFKAAASLRSSVTGKQIHGLSVKCGRILDVFAGCSAFDMYCKTKLRGDARKMSREAVRAFIEFRKIGGHANSLTFCAFLDACSDELLLSLGVAWTCVS
ncbi:unnamed protein product [Brassica rapa]|uniref:Uncharacterized protein n=1 Tax=Brassica campestris TaxID=3711 RepID=A0A3P6CMJ6_BRACM|nr:unnamed protein product [Brassica rapa]VDD11655.1 unnamed protein product [Brassica rapa]